MNKNRMIVSFASVIVSISLAFTNYSPLYVVYAADRIKVDVSDPLVLASDEDTTTPTETPAATVTEAATVSETPTPTITPTGTILIPTASLAYTPIPTWTGLPTITLPPTSTIEPDPTGTFTLTLTSAPTETPTRVPTQPAKTNISGNITADTTWTLDGSPYNVITNLTIPLGVTLTIDPGVEVRFNPGTGLNIHGALHAIGTAAQPIVFSDTLSGWSGITFYSDSDDSHNILEYADIGYALKIDIDAASPIIEHSIVHHGMYGLNVRNTNLTLSSDTFRSNYYYGVFIQNATVHIEDSIIQSNQKGVYTQGSTVTLENCNISSNTIFAIQNASPNPAVQAVNNWWGHYSGPYHATTNLNGLGNEVSDNVAFDPWQGTSYERQATALTLNQPITGLTKLSQYADYSLVASAGQSLLIKVTPLAGSQTLWVSSRLGLLPAWTRYDLRTQALTEQGIYELLIPSTQAGTYYFSIFGQAVAGAGGNFQIEADTVTHHISSIAPGSVGNSGEITVSLAGMPFITGMQVELRHAGRPTLSANSVVLIDSASLQAHFSLSGAAAGMYDVVAIWPGQDEASLSNSFTITPGTGSRLEASLVPPPAVRAGGTYTLWLNYANKGDADMTLPLFTVSSPSNIPMRLNNQDAFEVKQQQIIGLNPNAATSVLPPGASGRIPIYFQANGGLSLQFDLSVMTSDAQPIDWQTMENQVRPPNVNTELWNVLWPSLTAQIGTTWGDYHKALANDASYLGTLGRQVSDVNALLRFEISKAFGMIPRAALTGRLDAYAPAAGLPLQFGEVFPGSLDGRFYLGSLGRGWSHNYDIFVEEQSNGDIVLHLSGNSTRWFASKGNGIYAAQPGDAGVLTRPGGLFKLTEKDGTHYQFRADYKLDYIEDANSNRISLTYNGNSQLTLIHHSNNDNLTLEYNAQGRISRLTDQAGQVTEYGYNPSGEHLITVTIPGNRTTTYTYAASSGQIGDHTLLSVTGPDGRYHYFGYDVHGRLDEEHLDANIGQTTYTYDSMSRITTTSGGITNVSSPNENGDPTKGKDGVGQTIGAEYDAALNLTSLTDAAGQKTRFSYDSWGNLIAMENPLGHRTTLGYDTRFSKVSSVQDARGNRSAFTYNAAGNLTTLTYPGNSQEVLAYDPQGNLTTFTARNGSVVHYTYNTQGQLLHKDYPNGSWVAFTYDSAGNITSASDLDGAITMTYDPVTNLMTGIAYPSGHSFTFTYDLAGRRTRRVGDDGYILNYHYDSAGRLESLTDGSNAELVHYAYDSAAQLTRESKGNGTYATYTYNAAGQATSLVNYAPNDSVQSRFDYVYDVNGNRTSMTTLEGTTHYDYDLIGQLIGVTYPDARHVVYAYDADGNRITVSDNGIATSYTSNNLNQYTQAGTTTYSYDANGNMTSKTDASGTTTYTYDYENRLTQVVQPGNDTWVYTYDALGNRTAVSHNGTETKYVLDPSGMGDVAAEYNGSGALAAHYIDGIGLVARVDAAGDSAYYAFDVIGNTRQVSNSAGAVANNYNYDPFGIQTQTSETIPNPFRYVGRFGVMVEGNGLNFMRARYYNSSTGGFTSADPLGLQAGNINLYLYANNNPLSIVDPEGTFLLPLAGAGAVGGAVINGVGYTITSLWITDNFTFRGLGGAVVSGGVLGFVVGATGGAIIPGILAGGVGGAAGYAITYAGTDQFNVKDMGIATVLGAVTGPIPTKMLGFKGSFWGVFRPGFWKTILLKNAHGRSLAKSLLWGNAASQLGSWGTSVIRSADPNEKIGPLGAGAQGDVLASDTLPYEIYFENMATASAPAQEIVVTDYLDPDLDWSTFRMTEITWGDQVIVVPSDITEYPVRVIIQDYRPEVKKSWWVDVNVEVSAVSGRARWTLRMLDPETGELPEDALAGFLPPNDSTGRGEGHIGYTILPQVNSPAGTILENQASIVFDTNEPILTNTVTNTIGALPTSFSKESPLNVTTGQTLNPTLTWGSSSGGLSYEYCYDTTNNAICDGTWVSTNMNTSVGLSNLSANTTYYWQVRAANLLGLSYANGSSTAWWSFSTFNPTSTVTVTPTRAPIGLLTPTPTQTPGVITLKSAGSYDGWVLESSETSNTGGSLSSAATTFNLGDDATKKQYRGILSFSTGASLPDVAHITGVTLKIKKSAVVGGGNPVSTFQGFMLDVKKGLFSTSALQITDFQTLANKTYGPFNTALVGGWYSINLANPDAYINKLATSGGLTQIRLRFKLDDNNNAIANYLSLFSGNAPAANRPQLVITYYVP